MRPNIKKFTRLFRRLSSYRLFAEK
jgi:hypothetical protein